MDNLEINFASCMQQESLMHSDTSSGLREILRMIDLKPETENYVTIRQASRISGIRAKVLMEMMDYGQLDYILKRGKALIAKVNLPKMSKI